jgi:phage tail protein X
MSNFVEYVSKQGDRWDIIAMKAYGDASLINGLIESNASVVISPIIPLGTRIIVPILESGDIQIDSELLPPWKR